MYNHRLWLSAQHAITLSAERDNQCFHAYVLLFSITAISLLFTLHNRVHQKPD